MYVYVDVFTRHKELWFLWMGAGVLETHFSNFDYVCIYIYIFFFFKFWDLDSSFSNQGSNPYPLQWGRGVLITGLLGKFL